MKALPAILVIFAIYGLFQVTIQTFRHAYVRWVAPRESVLLKYDKTKEDILTAKSLEELTALYDEALTKKKQWEVGKTDQEKREADSGSQEPHMSEWKLRKAIETWESQYQEIYQLQFYWWCGFAIFLAGLVSYVSGQHWLGVAWLITAFAEMIWWTCPTWNLFYTQYESDRLLLFKFIYSVATLVLLLAVWLYLGRYFFGLRRSAAEPVDAGASANEPKG